jgi:dynein intermediate chain
MVDREMQTLSMGPLATVYEFDGQVTNDVKKNKEVITYSKGVQASIGSSPTRARGTGPGSDSERDESPTRSPKSKRLSRRQKERDEEIRTQLRKEIEEELKAAQQAAQDGSIAPTSDANFPFKTLSNEELMAVENSDDFLGFVERSTKVLERALDQQLDYDILADYALGGLDVDDEDEGYGSSGGKKGRRIKEVAQFWDERWSKKRMISDLDFSTKVRITPCPIRCPLQTFTDMCPSSPSSSSPRIPRTHPPHTIQMASFKSGTCTCTIVPSGFFMPSPTSSPPSSLHSTLISSSEERIRVKC